MTLVTLVTEDCGCFLKGSRSTPLGAFKEAGRFRLYRRLSGNRDNRTGSHQVENLAVDYSTFLGLGDPQRAP